MRRLVATLVAALGLAAAAGAATTPGKAPAAASLKQVDAHAWLVLNPVTGEVLAAHGARARRPIASITKLMTVLVALRHLKLDQVVSVDARAAAVGQESVYLRAGQRISVLDLVKAALIQSANDAAAALALAVSPSFDAFAVLMNAEAHRLGLTDSHFVRPDGLDAPDEYSSARDVTRLAIAAMRLPIVRRLVHEKTDTIEGGSYTVHTWDDLLSTFPGLLGGKTGHTDGAGWGQVAAVRGDGTTIYAAILGSPTRDVRNTGLTQLLAYGLAQYRRVDVISAGRTYASVHLPYGRKPVGLVATASLETVARVGGPITQRVVAPSVHGLPVLKGQRIGRIEVWARGKLIGHRPLVASRTVVAPGFAGKAVWYAGRAFHNIVSIFK